jgi:adenylate cyclase
MKPLIEKIRFTICSFGQKWEIDVFLRENSGLVVAEIELEQEDQPIELPEWLGEEVSHDSKYYNANLAVNPFMKWKKVI